MEQKGSVAVIYEIYIDKLIFILSVMNFYLLSLVNASTYQNTSLKRILCGAFTGTAGFLVPFCFPWPPVIRFGVGTLVSMIGMLKLVYPRATLRRFLYFCEKFAIYSFVMGGALIFIMKHLPQQATNVVLLAFFGGALYLGLLRYRICIKRADSLCRVRIKSEKGEVTAEGLVDTGNGLFEPISGSPVCVVDDKTYTFLCDEEKKGFRIVPYNSIGKKGGVLHASMVDAMEIEMREAVLVMKNVYIASGQEFLEKTSDGRGDQTRIILHPKLVEESQKYGASRRKVGKYDFQNNVAGKNPAQPDS